MFDEADTRHPLHLATLIARARGKGFYAPPIALTSGEWWKGLARLELRSIELVKDRQGRL